MGGARSLVSEIVICKGPISEQPLRKCTEHSNVRGQKCLHRTVIKKQFSREQLHQDAAERPEINFGVVSKTKDHLGSTIRAALYIAGSSKGEGGGGVGAGQGMAPCARPWLRRLEASAKSSIWDAWV